jgi:hypothetical protein
MRVLVAGWPSFVNGEATAGDELSMRQVDSALGAEGIDRDLVWSPVFRPEGLHFEDANPARYTHVVFVCGPAHGWQVRELHRRYANCRRIAVGVSVIDPDDPAVRGFDKVLPRDGGRRPFPDLAAGSVTSAVPVVGVVLAPDQQEYGERRRHDQVHARLLRWVAALDCARVPLDTRLDSTDWRLCATGDQFLSLLARLDAVVTTRLHGLVLALRAGIPALAVDPIAGTGKVAAQARALGWPAWVSAETALDVRDGSLDRWWHWCLSPEGRERAAGWSPRQGDSLLAGLLDELGTRRASAVTVELES